MTGHKGAGVGDGIGEAVDLEASLVQAQRHGVRGAGIAFMGTANRRYLKFLSDLDDPTAGLSASPAEGARVQALLELGVGQRQVCESAPRARAWPR